MPAVGGPGTARRLLNRLAADGGLTRSEDRYRTYAPTDGIVRSHSGTITRKRDQASQAQNNNVERPATFGPSP